MVQKTMPGPKTILKKLILYVAIIYVMLVGAMIVFQRSLIYIPDKTNYSQVDVGVSAYTNIDVTTADGLKLHGWYSAPQPGKATIIMFHGNAGSFQWRAPDFLPAIKQGYGVMLAEYRGYGGNPGSPSEAGLYSDAEAFLKYAEGDLKLPANKIVLYGESLGTGVAADMAAKHPELGGLVLESPYTTIPAIASFHYPFIPFASVLVRDKYDTESKIEKIKIPTLVFVGDADVIVPPTMGPALFARLSGRKALKVYPGVGHLTLRHDGAMPDLLDFLKTI